MLEITNDIRFLLPIMTAVIVSKLVADAITHSLYHALLEVRAVPVLLQECSALEMKTLLSACFYR